MMQGFTHALQELRPRCLRAVLCRLALPRRCCYQRRKICQFVCVCVERAYSPLRTVVHILAPAPSPALAPAARWLLGGKGSNLAEMAALGLNIPPGFTLTTEVCSQYCASGPPGVAVLSDEIWAETIKGLRFVEEAMGASSPTGMPQL